jgi:hypothetical protein
LRCNQWRNAHVIIGVASFAVEGDSFHGINLITTFSVKVEPHKKSFNHVPLYLARYVMGFDSDSTANRPLSVDFEPSPPGGCGLP